jgi:hypothetical protein
MPGLREMIRREIARREEDGQQWPAFAFIVSDDAPDVDIDATVETIVSLAGDPAAEPVYINRGQQGAVVSALEAKFPRRWIIMRTIVGCGTSRAERPDVRLEGDDMADAQLARAAERIPRLRDESR